MKVAVSPTAAAAVGRRHNSAPGEQLGRSSNEAENVEDSSHPEERSSDESKHRHSKKPMPRVSCLPSTPDGGPVVVYPSFGIHRMHAYPQNGLEVVDMTIVLELSWIDERFKNWPTKAPVPSDTWKPKVFSSRTPSLVEGWASASVQILEPDTGMMVMSFSGTAIGHPIAFDSNRMSSFPFDRLHVSTHFAVYNTEAANSANEVVLQFREFDRHGKRSIVSRQCLRPQRLNTPDWTFAELRAAIVTYYAAKKYYCMDIKVALDRHGTYFVNKAMAPMWITVLLCALGCVIPVNEVADRLALYLSMFLTAYAIQWVIVDYLPRSTTLTSLDWMHLFTISAHLLFCIEAAVTVEIQRSVLGGGSRMSDMMGIPSNATEDEILDIIRNLDIGFVCAVALLYIVVTVVMMSIFRNKRYKRPTPIPDSTLLEEWDVPVQDTEETFEFLPTRIDNKEGLRSLTTGYFERTKSGKIMTESAKQRAQRLKVVPDV